MRKTRFFIVFFLIFALIFTGCSGDLVKSNSTLLVDDYNGLKLDELNKYEIEVDFHPEKNEYTAKQSVTYVNNTNETLNEVYFHVYPNAFRTKETAPFLFDDFAKAYPNGFDPGYVEFDKIKVNGNENKFSFQGKGDTILKIPLEKKLKPKDKVKIHMEYEVKIPSSQDRFGYGEKTFNFGNWYPIACVYDEQKWNLDPYYSIGDPFYSDTSNYEVTITTPKEIVVASSGNILSEKIKKDKKIWKIEGKLIRDFAWVASEDFIVKEKKVDGTVVKNYFLEDKKEINDFAQKVSCDVIRLFNKIYGKYPYGQYSVVATNFPSGMEYPGIVFISKKYYDKEFKNRLEIVIAHETSHQWWYSVVGNDEIDEAWLDESLACYSETLYIGEMYGNTARWRYYVQTVEDYYERMKDIYKFDDVILKPLNEFENWNDYGPLVYDRGAMFINKIRQDYSKEVLYDILKEYYSRYKFLNANTEGFLKVCEDVTGDDFKDRALKWLYGED